MTTRLVRREDPGKQRPREVNDYAGGRRVYFDDPDGHLLEIFTRE